MSLRVALYSRYSSEMQNPKSIEDQIHICTDKANIENWHIVQSYSDAAVSGASLHRPGIQALLRDAMQGVFDVVLCEGLDRLSRDQQDIAGIYKRLNFCDIPIETLSEGKITTMHIGLKGTLNAMQLEDLKLKTRRGMAGVVKRAKSAGGIAFGYNVVRRFDALGQPIKGEREINKAQANTVRKIYELYAYDNQSPKAIAAMLNANNILGISGKPFGFSTILGNRRRGTGILNNELYIGKLVWNRLNYRKDPDTGKRVSRLNDESKWVLQDVPDLRIVSDELWQAVKERQKSLDGKALTEANRPQYLLSGLLKCGQCDGGYVKINQTHYGCSTSHNKGASVCDNRKTIRRDKLEGHVLGALQNRLMDKKLIKIFCQEFENHYSALIAQQQDLLKQGLSQIYKLEKQKNNMLQAIKDGLPMEIMKDDLIELSAQLKVLQQQQKLQDKVTVPPIHEGLTGLYVKKIKGLKKDFMKNATTQGIREQIRGLIDKITLTPVKAKKANTEKSRTEKVLKINLYGKLSALFTLANAGKNTEKYKGKKSEACNDFTFLDNVGCGSRI